MSGELLKNKVKQYWNKAACGSEVTVQEKLSRQYFDEIEEFRYRIEPEIFSFAQFSRARGKKVLEIGVGAGTDFVQWVRSGASAYGIDLTEEAVSHVQKRLAQEGLVAACVEVGDAENLSFQDNCFDIVYSWGVIHHSPDTKKCLSELVRVAKVGGKIKVMVYNRRSLFAFYRYLIAGVFSGKPFQSISKILFNNQESLGTKAYTRGEIKKMVLNMPVKIISLTTNVTSHDLLYYKSKPARVGAYFLATIFGWFRVGWFLCLELEKIEKN